MRDCKRSLSPHFRSGRVACERPCDNCILSVKSEPWFWFTPADRSCENRSMTKPKSHQIPLPSSAEKLMRLSRKAPSGVHVHRPVHDLQISSFLLNTRTQWTIGPAALIIDDLPRKR